MSGQSFMGTSKRLQILEQSLLKKEKKRDDRLEAHFSDVASANGQPLNDKKGGRAVMARWDGQSNGIRNAIKEIEKTEIAIEREQCKINAVEESRQYLPQCVVDMVESGELNQWRKYPHIFFVPEVEKARFYWDKKKEEMQRHYVSDIPDQTQYSKFREMSIKLKNALNPS